MKGRRCAALTNYVVGPYALRTTGGDQHHLWCNGIYQRKTQKTLEKGAFCLLLSKSEKSK